MKNKLLLTGIAALSCFFSVKMNAQAPTAAFSLSQPSVCAGGTLQVLDASTDAPTAWSYTVEGPTTINSVLQSPVFTLTTPGNYSVTLVATNGVGDSSPLTQTLSVKVLPIVAASAPTEICMGTSVTFSGTGASTYAWSDNVTDGTAFTPTGTTVYTVTGTDVDGCKSDATVSLTVHALPVLTVAGSKTICTGAALTLTASGAATFTWSSGQTTDNIMDTPTTNTTYVTAGTDAVTGCTNTVSSAITVNTLPAVTVNSGGVCTGDTFTITANGAATYVYSNGSNTVAPVSNDSYTVTGTDANGCVASAVSNVTVNALPVVAVTGGTLCSGAVFTLAPTGAVTYSYAPSLTATVSPVATTAYSVSGVDANGCKSAVAAVAEITVSISPTITVNSGSICAGQVFTITPNADVTNTVSFVNGSTTVSPSSSVNYTVAAVDALGCRTEAVAQLIVVALPVITVNSGTICSGGVFTITPNGANTYTFVNGSNTVNPTSNTSYSVSGSTIEGCLSVGYAVSDVTVNALPVVGVSSGSTCLGIPYTMVGTGAATYIYEGGSASVSPLASTNYTVIGVSAEGCHSSNTATSTVNVWSLPVITVTSASAAICSGETTTLTVNGTASTYTWVVSNSNATNYTVNPTANTTYTVIGTDANGCNNFAIQSLIVNALPTVAVNSGIICPGGSFTIIPTGALSYVIQGGTATVTPAATTTYSVMGTDANGCISAVAAVSTVSVVTSLTINVTGNTTICQGQTANLIASGATTYSWNATTLTNTIAVNPSTTTNYVVTGMASGCSNTVAVTVVVNALPVVTVTSSSALLCVGESATLTSTGAVTYSWDNNSTSTSIVVSPVVTTTYVVTGTAANTCSNKTTIVQNVSDCTGIAKIDNASVNVGIYPNPTNREFTVKLTQETSVKILNGIGQIVYTNKLANGETVVTLNDQPNGIYFVQLTQGNNTKTVKVVKN